MAETLRNWLRTRLGVIMDLTPEIFGHHTTDGTLLAHILHSYDIINCDQLSTIIHTQDPALSRVNLRHLRVWLRFIGVDCNDECIEEISRGKGTTSLQLFYKVYLSLEDKDRLHFITLQKEREKYIPASSKFDVIPVFEDPPPYEPPEHPLAKPLVDAIDTIDWYRQRSRHAKHTDEEFLSDPSITKKSKKTMPFTWNVEESEEFLSGRERKNNRAQDNKEMKEFTRNHPVKQVFNYDPCGDGRRHQTDKIQVSNDPQAAKEYIEWLRNRDRKNASAQALRSSMHKALLADMWEQLAQEQERRFDERLAKRVLDQSHYEKQMMTKLIEVRDRKNAIVANRRMVDDLILVAREREISLEQGRLTEVMGRETEDLEAECRRMCELRQRIRDEKIKRSRQRVMRICNQVAYDLVDIAIKVSEYRDTNDGVVPVDVWNEVTASFLKSLSIFQVVVKNDKSKSDLEEIVRCENERQEALNDADFQNYCELRSPWDVHVPTTLDEEITEFLKLGERVLGYVVHRLLEFIYPYPMGHVTAPVPKVSVAAIILGVRNTALYEPIQILLQKSNIRLIRMEDTINYCLAKYKEEMCDTKYVDTTVMQVTACTVKRLEAKDKTDPSPRQGMPTSRMRKTVKSKVRVQDSAVVGSRYNEHKETQTPRNIPYDDLDPVLTDTAYVGKWIYEFFSVGQPLSDELTAKIFVEYLKSIENVTGWALIDYPNTYNQMASLEFALTGRKVPDDPTVLDLDNINIEDVDPVSPRIVYEGEEVDTFAQYRQFNDGYYSGSRLLPNPICRKEDYESSQTFMTTYVRAIPKPKGLDVTEDELFEVLPEDITSVDKFYADQNVAYVLYYTAFNLPTLKKLARLVIGDKSLPRKPSLELFGEVLLKAEQRKDPPLIDSKAPIIKRILSESNQAMKNQFEEEEEDEIGVDDFQAAGDYSEHNVGPTVRAPKPGEEGWQWVDFPQTPMVLDVLASLWENLEDVYVQGLKEIFSLKRQHFSVIIPYKDFVMRNMKEFIERPDCKQDLLHEFHQAFNNIDEDMRDDEGVKCELHCRVAEFQSRLWDICDERRQEAEKERRRIIQSNWTDVEAVILINIYVGILQLELDRCIDTVQLLQDYYTTILQKPMVTTRLSKILLNKVAVESVLSQIMEDSSDQLIIKGKESSKGEQKYSKLKIGTARTSPFDSAGDQSRFSSEIADLFLDTEQTTFDPTQSSTYKAILDSVEYVRSVVESIAATVNETLKKEEIASVAREKATKRKAQSTLFLENNLVKRGLDIVQEWRYAVFYEINRIRTKLDVLTGAALTDVSYLVNTLKTEFHRIYEQLVDRYTKEKKSVDTMATVFCFAIEEGRSIQEEMLLDGPDFVVRSNVLLYPDKSVTTAVLTKEPLLPSQFAMMQLGRLMDVFRRVAPLGSMSERSLIYIIQDLIYLSQEEGGLPLLPTSWNSLRPCDVTKLVEELFGFVECVEWREFIIYAMDLPMPSHYEILSARECYRALDPELKEIVTRDQYHSVPLWFFKCTETSPEAKRVLHENFQRNILELYPEEVDFTNPDNIGGITVPKKAKSSIRSKVDLESNDVFSVPRVENIREEATKLILAKELLCQLFLTTQHTVNYTALLLAFCKNEDPREGFAMALTLAMGARVCTDVEEGEKYIEYLVERKRFAIEAEISRDYLHEEAIKVTKDIIGSLLDRAVRGIIIEDEKEAQYYSKFRTLIIEKLDEPAEYIDPKDLMMQEPGETILDDSLLDKSKSEEEFEQVSSFMMPECEDRFGLDRDEGMVIHWIPYDVCLAVLTAVLPSYTSQPKLLGTSMSLRKLLRRAYDELKDKELDDIEEGTVLSHRLLNHDLITQLLNSTSKFTIKRMGNLLRKVLLERETMEST